MKVVELAGGLKVFLEDDGGFKVSSVFGEEVCFDHNGNEVFTEGTLKWKEVGLSSMVK